MGRETVMDAVKASPVLAYIMAVLNGYTLQDWATMIAIAYSLMLIADKLRQWGLFRACLNWIKRPISKP